MYLSVANVTLQEYLSGKGGVPSSLPVGFKPFSASDSLFENAVDNIGDIATGLIPGLAKLGGNALQDIAHAATLGAYGDQFKTDDNLTNMAKGWWGSSPIPSLLQGEFAEAGHRFHERPVDALLDFGGIGSVAAKAGIRAGESAALTGKVLGIPVGMSPTTATNVLHKLGYNQMAFPAGKTAKEMLRVEKDPARGLLDEFAQNSAQGTGQVGRVTDAANAIDRIDQGSVELFSPEGDVFRSMVHRGMARPSSVILNDQGLPTSWKRQTHRMIGVQPSSKAPVSLSKLDPEEIDTQALVDAGRADSLSAKHGSFETDSSELGVMAAIPRSKWEHIARARDWGEDVYAKYVPEDKKLLGLKMGNLYRAGRVTAKHGMTDLTSGAAAISIVGDRAKNDLYKGLDKADYEAADLASFMKDQGFKNTDDFIAGFSKIASGESTLTTLKELKDSVDALPAVVASGDDAAISAAEFRIAELKDRAQWSYRGSRLLSDEKTGGTINVLGEVPDSNVLSYLIQEIEPRVLGVTGKRSPEDIVNRYGRGGIRRFTKPIVDHKEAIEKIMNDQPRMEKWLEHAIYSSRDSEQLARANYRHVLNDASVERNKWKLHTLMHGTDDIDKILQSPIAPVRTPVFRTGQGKHKTDPDVPDMGFEKPNKIGSASTPPKSSRSGSIIEGSLRVDPLAHTDNQRYQKVEFARNKLVDDINSVAVRMSPEEFALMKQKDLVGEGSLTEGGTHGPIRPFVEVDGKNPVIDKAGENIVQQLISADALEKAGEVSAANLLRQQILDSPAADIVSAATGVTKVDLKSIGSNADSMKELLSQKASMHTIIPRQYYEPLAELIARDSTAITQMLDNTSQWWKQAVLHWRAPTWMRNNLVSNIIISALSAGPRANAKAFFNHLEPMRQVAKKFKGEEWANQARDFTNVLNTSFTDVKAGQGFTSMMMDNIARKSDKKAMQGYLNAIGAVANINAKMIDDPWRGINLHTHAMKYVDEYKRNAELRGVPPEHMMSDEQILQDLLRHDGIRQEIADATLSDMINFQDMGPWERRVIYRMLPFWSWIKGMNKRAKRFVIEDPEMMAAQSAVSSLGNEWVEEEIGPNLPSFLKSQIPVGDEGYSINLGGANPFQTPADMAKLIASYVPGGPRGTNFGSENLLGMTHPLLKAPIEAQTRRDIFTGQPLSDNGMNTGELLLSRATNVPIMQFLPYGNPLDALFSSNRDATPPFMRPSTLRSTTDRSGTRSLAAYLTGVNVAKVRPYAAQERGLEEYMDRYS